MFGKEVCTSDLDAFYDQQAVEYIRQNKALPTTRPRIIHDSPLYHYEQYGTNQYVQSPGYEKYRFWVNFGC